MSIASGKPSSENDANSKNSLEGHPAVPGGMCEAESRALPHFPLQEDAVGQVVGRDTEEMGRGGGYAAIAASVTKPFASLEILASVAASADERVKRAIINENTIEIDSMPGGRNHCGGDFVLTHLQLQQDEMAGRMPLFVMAPGSIVAFPGADLYHCTTEHDSVERRPENCKAHISFAVQTPSPILGQKKSFTNQVHTELLALGGIDGTQHWKHAVWLPVRRLDCKTNPVPTKKISFKTNKDELFVLGWRRIVLFDADVGRNAPLVFYDMNGGLQQQDAALARSHFSFLKTWQFKLDRHSNESNTTGCLHLDKRGSQRMEMLGIRSRGRNKHHPPNIKRPQIQIANRSGDLDLYVVHHDHEKFQGSKNVEIIWEAISKRMHAALPQVSERMVKELQKARVHERVYSAGAANFLSRDLLVNNVGVSESYQSPPHIDKNDIGWTYAFACKCGPCSCNTLDDMTN